MTLRTEVTTRLEENKYVIVRLTYSQKDPGQVLRKFYFAGFKDNRLVIWAAERVQATTFDNEEQAKIYVNQINKMIEEDAAQERSKSPMGYEDLGARSPFGPPLEISSESYVAFHETGMLAMASVLIGQAVGIINDDEYNDEQEKKWLKRAELFQQIVEQRVIESLHLINKNLDIEAAGTAYMNVPDFAAGGFNADDTLVDRPG